MSRLDAAWARRSERVAALAASGTDCFRLVDGAGDGIDGLVVEVFGSVAILQEHVGRYRDGREGLLAAAAWVRATLPSVRAVYWKRFVADRTSAVDEALHRDPKPLLGDPVEPVVVARENGKGFRIRPYDGYSVGLFLDQRDHRRVVTEALGPGKAALNLFAYTAGFSVYAAARGATTDTIDLSRRYLEWGKENFAENGIAAEGHRFFADNATVFLRRAAKRPKRYDLIVLDPPSFSRSKEGTFRVRTDLPNLAVQALALLAPGGLLFLSSNHEAWPLEAFDAEMRTVFEDAPGKVWPLPPAPFDFVHSAAKLRALAFRRDG